MVSYETIYMGEINWTLLSLHSSCLFAWISPTNSEGLLRDIRCRKLPLTFKVFTLAILPLPFSNVLHILPCIILPV